MQLAAQLYTLREFTKTEAGFANALERCKAMGYEGVQLSAVGCMNGDSPEVSAERARQLLDDNGLICCATHRPQDRLVNHTGEEIDFHLTLGCDYTAVGGAFNTGDVAAGYRAFLNDVTPMIAKLKAAGIRFGYHNHAHEFIRDPESSSTMLDILMEEGPDDLMFEIDTYWVVHAGVNLISLLQVLDGRLPVIHAKDKEVVSKLGPVMAPVGEGNLDWDSIVHTLMQVGCEWAVVEQDDYLRDPFDCLQSSYNYLRRMLA